MEFLQNDYYRKEYEDAAALDVLSTADGYLDPFGLAGKRASVELTENYEVKKIVLTVGEKEEDDTEGMFVEQGKAQGSKVVLDGLKQRLMQYYGAEEEQIQISYGGEMTERLKEFLQQKRWLQLKKTDWIAVALVGVLLLVVAMPSGGTGIHLAENKKEDTAQEKTEQKYEKEDYAEYLEHKLEQVLGQMEGVGKVSVMVTVADQGEDIIEKDKTEHTSTVTNTDSGSMEMTTEKESGEETVYEESGGEKAPYVSKEILPEIEGVLVVAEGGDSPRIVSDISDAVKALFQVEAHRIKVVKMSSKEDGT